MIISFDNINQPRLHPKCQDIRTLPYGAGAAYMGMIGHLGPMRESRGGPGFGAASYGVYGGGYNGGKCRQRQQSVNN